MTPTIIFSVIYLFILLAWARITTRARKELYTLQRLSSIYGEELDSVIRVAKALRDFCEASDQEREAELHSRLAAADLNLHHHEEEEEEV